MLDELLAINEKEKKSFSRKLYPMLFQTLEMASKFFYLDVFEPSLSS
jgi:hypothetical protein